MFLRDLRAGVGMWHVPGEWRTTAQSSASELNGLSGATYNTAVRDQCDLNSDMALISGPGGHPGPRIARMQTSRPMGNLIASGVPSRRSPSCQIRPCGSRRHAHPAMVRVCPLISFFQMTQTPPGLSSTSRSTICSTWMRLKPSRVRVLRS